MSDRPSARRDVPLRLVPCCVHLRHKMMYVDEAQMVPGFVDDSSSTRVFWCAETGDPLGCDGRPVDPESCGSDGRGCFRAGPTVPPPAASSSI